VRQLDESTQQNAALVEQTAAASGSLADQAQRLSSEVAFFRLV
jgi:methyl-accepting chemotaxis protein